MSIKKHLNHNFTHQTEFGVYFKLTYNPSMKKLVSIFKFCYKFIFQFISYLLIGFGIYKGKIEDKDKETS